MKFEYKIMQEKYLLLSESELNRMGDQGWELVTHHYSSGVGHTFIFKRQRPNLSKTS